MVKILVADLFGTLIPETIIKGDYLYGKGSDRKTIDKICNDNEYHRYLLNKICQQCINILNKFLVENNQLIIVSDLTSHDTSIDFILDEIIDRLHNYINFELFLITKGGACSFDITKLTKIHSQYIKDKINYITYDGYKIGFIEKKEDVFDILENKYNLEETEFYTIGNSSKDIPMIVKCIELGGKGSLLNYNLYSNTYLNNMGIDEIIRNKSCNDCMIMNQHRMLESFPNYSDMKLEERYKIDNLFLYSLDQDFINKRYKELYMNLRNGILSIDELIKQDLIFNIVEEASHYYTVKKTIIENKYEEITMYSTFLDYYNKVLSQDKKILNLKKSKINLI